jgi:hypothetical protein
MHTNVIQFPKPKHSSLPDRAASRRAYRQGMRQIAARVVEAALNESAKIPGAEEISAVDALRIFRASIRRELSRA